MDRQESFELGIESMQMWLQYSPQTRTWRATVWFRRQLQDWDGGRRQVREFAELEDAYDWVTRTSGRHMFA